MVRYRFTLSYKGSDTVVSPKEEPKNFSSVNSVIKRDFKTHGTFYRFTDGTLKLSFGGVGKQVLSTALLADGIDAIVTLKVERDVGDGFITIYVGQCNFISYEIDTDYFSADFEEISIQSLISARSDIEYSTSKTQDLEGGAISQSLINVNFNPLNIFQESSFGIPPHQISFLYSGGGSNPNPDKLNASSSGFLIDTSLFIEGKDEIRGGDDESSLISSVFDLTSQTEDVDLELFYDASVDESFYAQQMGCGYLFKNIKQIDSYEVSVNVQWNASRGTSFGGYCVLEYDVFENGREVFVNATRQIITATPFSPQSFDDDYTFTVSRFDKKIVFGWWKQDGVDVDLFSVFLTPQPENLTNVSFYSKASVLSVYPATTIKGQLIHEALDKNIQYITGQPSSFYSDFFGRTDIGYSEDGCGAYMLETNGYNIRKDQRGISASLKQRLDSLNSIFNIGHGVQYKDDDKTSFQFRVEQASYFYQDVELASFSDIESDSYSEEYFNDLAFNEIVTGYSMFSKDEDNEAGSSLDFNTKGSWSLPIKALTPEIESQTSRGRALKLISDYITSPYLMERTRRKQFSSEPTRTSKHDDDLFLIHLQKVDGVFSQLSREESVVITGGGELFSQISSGVKVVDSYFNFLLAPISNLFNHSTWLSSALFRKPQSSLLLNNDYKVNGDLNVVKTATSCLGSGLTIPSPLNTNISKEKLDNPIIDPIILHFKTAMTAQQAEDIKLAHQNGLNDSRNYGYITFTTPNGTQKKGWVMECKYNPVDEIASFKLIQKAGEGGESLFMQTPEGDNIQTEEGLNLNFI